jgi:thiamine biosynthesis protein ThiS
MKSLEAKILVNGQSRLVAMPCTIAELLGQAGLKSTQVVVEYNGTVLPRTCFAVKLLAEGDRLEVVVPVAGG